MDKTASMEENEPLSSSANALQQISQEISLNQPVLSTSAMSTVDTSNGQQVTLNSPMLDSSSLILNTGAVKSIQKVCSVMTTKTVRRTETKMITDLCKSKSVDAKTMKALLLDNDDRTASIPQDEVLRTAHCSSVTTVSSSEERMKEAFIMHKDGVMEYVADTPQRESSTSTVVESRIQQAFEPDDILRRSVEEILKQQLEVTKNVALQQKMNQSQLSVESERDCHQTVNPHDNSGRIDNEEKDGDDKELENSQVKMIYKKPILQPSILETSVPLAQPHDDSSGNGISIETSERNIAAQFNKIARKKSAIDVPTMPTSSEFSKLAAISSMSSPPKILSQESSMSASLETLSSLSTTNPSIRLPSVDYVQENESVSTLTDEQEDNSSSSTTVISVVEDSQVGNAFRPNQYSVDSGLFEPPISPENAANLSSCNSPFSIDVLEELSSPSEFVHTDMSSCSNLHERQLQVQRSGNNRQAKTKLKSRSDPSKGQDGEDVDFREIQKASHSSSSPIVSTTSGVTETTRDDQLPSSGIFVHETLSTTHEAVVPPEITEHEHATSTHDSDTADPELVEHTEHVHNEIQQEMYARSSPPQRHDSTGSLRRVKPSLRMQEIPRYSRVTAMRVCSNASSSSSKSTAAQHLRVHSDELESGESLRRKISSSSDTPLSAGQDSKEASFDSVVTATCAPYEEDISSTGGSPVQRSKSAASRLSTRVQRKFLSTVDQPTLANCYKEEECNLNARQSKSVEDSLKNATCQECDDQQSVLSDLREASSSSSISSSSFLDMRDAQHKKRSHIIKELCDVEHEYVESLKMLTEKFIAPLKSNGILDSATVSEIFHQIPELYLYHTILNQTLSGCNADSTVGDKLSSLFTKQSVTECYVSFIENYNRAEETLEKCLATSSAFRKFVEQIQRDGRKKLPLKALIIQPAQRIPRYELLIKRLIEYTPMESKDYPLLLAAENDIHSLALKINSMKESKIVEDAMETLKKLEMLLMTELVSLNRRYIRHDLLNIDNKKDSVCLFMFTDQLIFTTPKRRATSSGKKSLNIQLQSSAGLYFVENTKYKIWLRLGLENIELVSSAPPRLSKYNEEIEHFEEDRALLIEITELTAKLSSLSHSHLDSIVKDLLHQINRQLEGSRVQQEKSDTSSANRAELVATTSEGINNLGLTFSSYNAKSTWESNFMEAKMNLVYSVTRNPEFLESLQITKTRAGMLFSCATAIDGYNDKNYRDVWICTSDGFVGHMCLLSLQPDPIVTLNTPVPGCSSRISCICAVPGYIGPIKRQLNEKQKTRSEGILEEADAQILPTLNLDTTALDNEISGHESSPEEISPYSSSDDEPNEDGHAIEEDLNDSPSRSRTSTDLSPRTISVNSGIPSPGISTLTRQKRLTDPYKGTMWLGMENGLLLIFYGTENVKTTRSKQKINLKEGIVSLLHFDNKVYVSLANGELLAYKRGLDGLWNFDRPMRATFREGKALKKLTAVTGKIWCGCQKDIVIINPITIKVERTFTVGQQTGRRSVIGLACSGHSVWVALENTTKVCLYHATTCEFLLDVDVSQVVAQKLIHCDDIIRQHKTACLRVTSLLAVKDLLWVGTSAGLILTVPTPKVTSRTTKSSLKAPVCTSLAYGYTGHVRFLTAVDMPGSPGVCTPAPSRRSHLARRASLTPVTTMATQMLVIAGGDGYEDFTGGNCTVNQNASSSVVMTSVSDANSVMDIGRDDSLNHLLIWEI